MDFIVSPKVLIGEKDRLIIPQLSIPIPSLVQVEGDNVFVNVGFALASLNFEIELLQEHGFDIEQSNALRHSDYSEQHYIGPHFRWEISGFFPNVKDEILVGMQTSTSRYLQLIIDCLSIEHLLKRDPTELSGGETAKIVIASHLIRKPKYLILDRIIDELDISSRQLLISNIKKLLPESVIFIVGEASVNTTEVDITFLIKDNKVSRESASSPNSSESLLLLTHSALQFNRVSWISDNCRIKLNIEKYEVFRASTMVLGPVSFVAAPGDVILVTGANGSGKTSFLEGLAGLLPENGKVYLEGNEVIVQDRGKAFSFSPQNPQCDITELDLYRELRYACHKKNKLDDIIDNLKIPSQLLHTPLNNDIGIQKLASVLSCIIRNRPCCLLDEPTLYLTPSFKMLVIHAIYNYSQSGGIVFCSSHDPHFISHVQHAFTHSHLN